MNITKTYKLLDLLTALYKRSYILKCYIYIYIDLIKIEQLYYYINIKLISVNIYLTNKIFSYVIGYLLKSSH